MYSFRNDYSELCHEDIIKVISSVNREQFDGYSEDRLSEKVKDKFKSILKNGDVDIHFISGGTQTNLVAISSVLKPYQAVIAAESAHIATHEAGAIEATGHKIITLKTLDGKLRAKEVEDVIESHYRDEAREHITQPAMLYISNPTEYGTIYKKSELTQLKKLCEKHNIPLYIDGARLAGAIVGRDADVSISDLPNLCDMFYLGGTKNGAMFGECLVIVNPLLKKDFRYNLKQKGALLAKGYAIALQFDALFKDDLYLKLAKEANTKANLINDELSSLGIKMLVKQESNQVFPILKNSVIEELRKEFLFYNWEKVDEDFTAIRLCTSWATDINKVHDFINKVKSEYQY